MSENSRHFSKRRIFAEKIQHALRHRILFPSVAPKLLPPIQGGAPLAVTLDTKSTVTNANGSGDATQTIGITISAAHSNRICVVCITGFCSGGSGMKTVKTGSTSFTLVKTLARVSPNDYYTEIWALVNPPTGAITITCTPNSVSGGYDFMGAAYSFYNVNQTTGWNPNNITTNQATSGNSTVTIQAAFSNSIILDSLLDQQSGSAAVPSAPTKNSGWSVSNGTNDFNGASQYGAPSVGNNTIGWTLTSSVLWFEIAIEILPFASEALLDNVAVTDSVSVLKVLHQSLSDTITVTDKATPIKLLSDTVQISDSITKSIGKFFTENPQFSDSVVTHALRNIAIADVVTVDQISSVVGTQIFTNSQVDLFIKVNNNPNRVLVVGVSTSGSTVVPNIKLVAAIDYLQTEKQFNFTKINSAFFNFTETELWVLVNPPVNAMLQVSFVMGNIGFDSDGCVFGCYSIYNANQTKPIGNTNSTQGFATSNNKISLIPSMGGSLFLDSFVGDQAANPPVQNQKSAWEKTSFAEAYGASQYNLSLPDVANVFSYTQIVGNWALLIAEVLPPGFIDTVSRQIGKSLSDTSTVTDSVSLQKGFTKFVTDTVSVQDSVSKKTGKAVSDVSVLLDVVSKNFNQAVQDNILSRDSLVRSIGIGVSDVVTIAESLVKANVKSLSDTPMVTDSIVKKTTKFLTDSILSSDVVTKLASKAVVDNVAVQDSVQKAVTKVITDAVTVSDQISHQFAIFLFLNDAIAFTDKTKNGVGKTLSEITVISDSLSKFIAKHLVDNLQAQDSISKLIGKSISDSPTFTDFLAMAINIGLLDTISLADTVQVFALIPFLKLNAIRIKALSPMQGQFNVTSPMLGTFKVTSPSQGTFQVKSSS